MFKDNLIRFLKAHGIAILAVAALSAVLKFVLHYSFILCFVILLILYFGLGFMLDILSEKRRLAAAGKQLKKQAEAEKGDRDNASADAQAETRTLEYDGDDNGTPGLTSLNAKHNSRSGKRKLKKLSTDMLSIIAASPSAGKNAGTNTDTSTEKSGQTAAVSGQTAASGKTGTAGKTGRKPDKAAMSAERKAGKQQTVSELGDKTSEFMRSNDLMYKKYTERNSRLGDEADADAGNDAEALFEEELKNAEDALASEAAAGADSARGMDETAGAKPADNAGEDSNPARIAAKASSDAEGVADALAQTVENTADTLTAAADTAVAAGTAASAAVAAGAAAAQNDIDTAETQAQASAEQNAAEAEENAVQTQTAAAGAVPPANDTLFFEQQDVDKDTEFSEEVSQRVDRIVGENRGSLVRRGRYVVPSRKERQERAGRSAEETEVRSHISADIDASRTLFGGVTDIGTDEPEPEDTVKADRLTVNALFPEEKKEKHVKPALEDFRRRREKLSTPSRSFETEVLGRKTAGKASTAAADNAETASETAAAAIADTAETAAGTVANVANNTANAVAATAVTAAETAVTAGAAAAAAAEAQREQADAAHPESAANAPENAGAGESADPEAGTLFSAEPEEDPLRPYEIPPIELLSGARGGDSVGTVNVEDDPKAQKLISTLESFGVGAKIIGIMRGPAVTRYEIQPNPGIKVSRIVSLSDDIALSLASTGVRIEAPIPGKEAVGIEVPNSRVEIVALRQVIESDEFRESASPLTVALGRDIAGNNIVADISKMPHVLIAGATGSGKSVCINTIIASILYKAGPADVRMIMIDPKIVELGVYNGIPHLLVPVVTNPKKAAGALSWAVAEMEQRYTRFSECNVRDLKAYNALAERTEGMRKMPQILLIIDELADLMMVAAKEIEESIIRLAQKARAAGLHIIIATQRPSVDVITGLIKANIPSRIAFAVTSQIDSRTILDGGGAEKLLGRGDMLFHPIGMSKPLRVQGAFVSDSEIEALADNVRSTYGTAVYNNDIQSTIDRKDKEKEKAAQGQSAQNGDAAEEDADNDTEMIDAAAQLALEYKQLSTSFLQRKLRLGYSRASRIVDTLEAEGLISAADGSRPRQLLMTKEDWEAHIQAVRNNG